MKSKIKKLTKMSASVGIVIPASYLDFLNWDETTEVELSLDIIKKELVIREKKGDHDE